MIQPRRVLQDLVGEQLSRVCFVVDYVEFDFNGMVLRSLANPKLSYQGKDYLFPDPGSRDALCTMIGSLVTQLDINDTVLMQLKTDKGHHLRIDLSPRAHEVMHFVSGDPRMIDVW